MSNFYTDVIKKDARFGTTARVSDLMLLEPVTRAAIQGIIADAKAQGITIFPFETYRSQELQVQLFNQGASKLHAVGVHHYGLACDLVKGDDIHPSWQGNFDFLRPLAAKYGLIWGGDWGAPDVKHSFIDADHVQRVSVADQNKLFSGAWYPEADYRP